MLQLCAAAAGWAGYVVGIRAFPAAAAYKHNLETARPFRVRPAASSTTSSMYHIDSPEITK